VITDKHKETLTALVAGAHAGRLAIIETTDKQGEPAIVVVIYEKTDAGMKFMPVARLFAKEPFDEVNPPASATEGIGTIKLGDALEA
jgi:fructose 1,6-bisphosphatase